MFRRFMGVLALLIGSGTGLWLLYHFFWPSPDFQQRDYKWSQIAGSLLCLLVGWEWVHGRPYDTTNKRK